MLHLLGPSPAWRAGRVERALPNNLPGWTVALLALRGEWVARERLTALLWPDVAPAEALHNLRMDLHRVRPLLAEWGVEAALEAERRRVRLVLPTDAAALLRAIEDTQAPLAATPGALLGSFAFEGFPALREWAELERAALAGRWRDAMLARLERATPTDAPPLALALLDADPLDDGAMQHLLRALNALGRSSDAQRHYAAYRERLQRELGVEPAPALRAQTAGLAAAALPEARTFVGRRLELAELAARLAAPSPRLHTLLGPGGVGKSRLAREAAARADVPTVWIDLQDLGSVDAAASRLARRLGLDLRDGADAVAQLAPALGCERRLVVLDNAEHLEGLGAFASRLLDAVPALTLLVTSRALLQTTDELPLRLEGLALPDEDSRDAEAAGAFDAVRLFEQRARAVVPAFELAPHIDAVIDIVEAVGGMPLAIELAAAWVRLLPPQAIARDLRGGIDALERDPADPMLPARPEHASLGAVLDRTWELSSERAREALAALSVFRGGFTHEAARAVAAVAMPLLSALADRSLLAIDEQGRFGMHPLLQAFAAARARDRPERLAAWERAHALHFAGCLATWTGQAAEPRAVVEAFDAEAANAEAAWRHAVDARHDALLEQMRAPWRTYFVATGKYRQSVRHFEAALRPQGPPLEQARLLATLAHFLIRDRQTERSLALATQALAVAESLHEAELEEDCVSQIAGCHLVAGRWAEARSWIERALGMARGRGARRETATQLANLGLVGTLLGDFAPALGHYEEAIAIQRELGNSANVARAMCNLGFALDAADDLDRAADVLSQTQRFATERGVRAVALEAEFLLGTVGVEQGRLDAAEGHLRHAREGFRATRNAGFELKTDCYLARIDGRRGGVDAAATTLLDALRTARTHGWHYDVLYAATFVAELLRAQGFAAAADRVLRSVRAAPLAHAYVRTLVDRVLTAPDASQRPPPAFDEVADALADAQSLQAAAAALTLR